VFVLAKKAWIEIIRKIINMNKITVYVASPPISSRFLSNVILHSIQYHEGGGLWNEGTAGAEDFRQLKGLLSLSILRGFRFIHRQYFSLMKTGFSMPCWVSLIYPRILFGGHSSRRWNPCVKPFWIWHGNSLQTSNILAPGVFFYLSQQYNITYQ